MKAIMRIRLRLLKKLIPGYALFFGFLSILEIISICTSGHILGLPFVFFAFVSLRHTFGYKGMTYHDKSTKRCICYSLMIFGVAALLLRAVPINVSLLFCVPVAVGMTWLLYMLGVKSDVELKLDKLTAPKKFDLDNCTEEELIARCKARFKRDVEYKTERAIKHFILKLPHSDIDVNPEQSKKERHRFRKILE